MSFNTLMHSRNFYKENTPDFKELAEKYPYFKSQSRVNTNGRVTIDFKNPVALRALLYALLDNDFNINIEVPLNRLIPTLPLRLNYIHWIEDLINCLGQDPGSVVSGVDIGSGASCIYPLLGAKLNKWRFLATEVDESSAQFSRENIKRNGFEHIITVQIVSPDDYLVKPLQDSGMTTATFCMCNPPFFSSEDEAVLGDSRTEKRAVPISVSTGSINETVTRGGEVKFVKGIIDDSIKLKCKVRWYTSMLGKKSSVKAIISYLKENKVGTITSTQFCQGKTMRWGVAWTFMEGIQVDTVKSPPSKRKKKESKSLSFIVPEDSPVLSCQEGISRFEAAVQWMDNILTELKVEIDKQNKEVNSCQWQCSASDKTWANQRQKRRKLKHEIESNASQNSTLQSNSFTHSVGSCQSSENKKTEVILVKDNGSLEHTNHTLPTNNQGSTLCSFLVSIHSEDGLKVTVQCIQANNKNDVYQFYQFLQNKLLQGCK